MTSITNIEQGISSYLDNELMTKLPSNGIQKVIAATAIAIAIKRIGNVVSSLKDNDFIKMLDIIDEDNNVDVDILRDELKKQIPEDGVKTDIPMIGVITFHKNDVDRLYDYIIQNDLEV